MECGGFIKSSSEPYKGSGKVLSVMLSVSSKWVSRDLLENIYEGSGSAQRSLLRSLLFLFLLLLLELLLLLLLLPVGAVVCALVVCVWGVWCRGWWCRRWCCPDVCSPPGLKEVAVREEKVRITVALRRREVDGAVTAGAV